MKYPEEIKDQLLHAEDTLSQSENYLGRSDENGNFPNKFEALRDLIADLMHYAEFHKVDFLAVYNNANYQYECEHGQIYSGDDAIIGVFDEKVEKVGRHNHG